MGCLLQVFNKKLTELQHGFYSQDILLPDLMKFEAMGIGFMFFQVLWNLAGF